MNLLWRLVVHYTGNFELKAFQRAHHVMQQAFWGRIDFFSKSRPPL